MNARLDIENQVANVKGHSGRGSFITNSLEAGVAPEIIAQSTKHKDSKTLMGYAKKSDALLGAAGLGISKRMKSDSFNTFGGHSVAGKASVSSSSMSMIQAAPAPDESFQPALTSPSRAIIANIGSSSSSASISERVASSIREEVEQTSSRREQEEGRIKENKQIILNFTFN